MQLNMLRCYICMEYNTLLWHPIIYMTFFENWRMFRIFLASLILLVLISINVSKSYYFDITSIYFGFKRYDRNNENISNLWICLNNKDNGIVNRCKGGIFYHFIVSRHMMLHLLYLLNLVTRQQHAMKILNKVFAIFCA